MIKYAFLTNNGLVNKINEDSIVFNKSSYSLTNIKKHGTLWFLKKLKAAVFDGVGGASKGEAASSAAATYFKEKIDICMDFDEKSLQKLTLKLHNAVKRKQKEIDCFDMLTTLVGVIINNNKLAIFNVGDSKAFLIRNNEINQLSKDDLYLDQLIKEGEISLNDPEINEYDHMITNALGTLAFDSNETHIKIIDLMKKDKILLMSDGISDLVSKEELNSILTSNNLKNSMNKIEELVLQRGAHDNYSLIILEI